jgi:hypothetical protein
LLTFAKIFKECINLKKLIIDMKKFIKSFFLEALKAVLFICLSVYYAILVVLAMVYVAFRGISSAFRRLYKTLKGYYFSLLTH